MILFCLQGAHDILVPVNRPLLIESGVSFLKHVKILGDCRSVTFKLCLCSFELMIVHLCVLFSIEVKLLSTIYSHFDSSA